MSLQPTWTSFAERAHVVRQVAASSSAAGTGRDVLMARGARTDPGLARTAWPPSRRGRMLTSLIMTTWNPWRGAWLAVLAATLPPALAAPPVPSAHAPPPPAPAARVGGMT